ncbi:MAG: hypothetical protein IPI32_06355 [Austwickia sp.]|nr:hypothetical protein [Austwickia sp.]MBK9102546.1 hypothetical protein [Austwickia sp.]
MRRNRKLTEVAVADTARDDAWVTIPVITGVEIDTGSRSLPSPAALTARYGPKAVGYAAAARSTATDSVVPRLEAAREAVAPRVEAAREAVGPRVDAARDAVGPRVDAARDAATERMGGARELLDENLPRLAKTVASALAAGAAATEEAKHRSADAALVLKGDATIKRRRSGLLGGSALRGVLAAVGVVGVASAVAAYLSRRASEQEDPWARPLADPYVAPSAPVVAPAPAPVVTPVPAAVDDTPVMDPADTPAVPKEDVEVVDLTADGTPPSDGEGAEGGAGSEDGEGSGSEQAPRG